MSAKLLVAAILACGIAVAAPARAEHTTSSHPEGGPVFVTMSPISLPLIQGTQVVRQVTLRLSLELKAGVNELAIDQVRPRLIEAFIEELTKIYEKTDLKTKVIDVVLVKKRLQASADRVLGSGVVAAVLIQQELERTN